MFTSTIPIIMSVVAVLFATTVWQVPYAFLLYRARLAHETRVGSMPLTKGVSQTRLDMHQQTFGKSSLCLAKLKFVHWRNLCC